MRSLSFRPSDSEIEHIVVTYSNMLFKLCFVLLGNNADSEDAVSDVLFKYITSSPIFNDEEHKKAWLITVATNTCKDMIKFRNRRNHLSLEDISEYCTTKEHTDILDYVFKLPIKYRSVIYLHYIEGYKTDEISKMLSISPGAVRKRLQYGRKFLKIEYGKDGNL